MCGRFTLTVPVARLPALFDLDGADLPELLPRYNICPRQSVAVVRHSEGQAHRELALVRWGLIPGWADDPSLGDRLINARSETAASKPSFRAAFRQRRCLVLADGFFEWQKRDGRKQPFYFRLQDGGPFGFAGLWEHWQGADGEVVESCTILTTAANEVLKPVHDRMPVIVAPGDIPLWLDPKAKGTDQVQALLRPYPAGAMTGWPVSLYVNNPRNDGPQCVEPVAA